MKGPPAYRRAGRAVASRLAASRSGKIDASAHRPRPYESGIGTPAWSSLLRSAGSG
jgi:hypothetical protein